MPRTDRTPAIRRTIHATCSQCQKDSWCCVKAHIPRWRGAFSRMAYRTAQTVCASCRVRYWEEWELEEDWNRGVRDDDGGERADAAEAAGIRVIHVPAAVARGLAMGATQ